MKLKTLKDFNFQRDISNFPSLGKDESLYPELVDKEEIKKEAIKWVKEDIEDYRNADLHLPNPPIGTNIHNFIVKQRQKWKDRLNISEEDLK